MDGTLIDSMGMWNARGDLYLDAFGIQKTREFDLVRYDVEYSELTRKFMDYYKIERELADVARDIELIVAEKYFHELPLKNGVVDMLEALKNRNIKMTVATATNSMLANRCFRRLGIDGYFMRVLSTKDIGSNKYRPDIYQMCAEIMGTDACETAVFEDALYAARTAKAAGFKVVGVYEKQFADGFSKLSALCDMTVKDYSDLEF